MSYDEALLQFHRRLFPEVLARNGWHIGRAAAELNVHRNTLSRLLEQAEVDVAALKASVRPVEKREAREKEDRHKLLAELVCEREGLKKEPFRIEHMMRLAAMAEKAQRGTA